MSRWRGSGNDELRRNLETAVRLGSPLRLVVATTPREYERVVDARGPGSEADFAPSHCYADYATWKAIREAGSLWLTARRRA